MALRTVLRFSASEVCLPVRTILLASSLPHCTSVVQVRGAKQKFGDLTRDPYRTLKKKLVLEKAQKVSKVPLMSSERREKMMEFQMNRTSSGSSLYTYTVLWFAKHAFIRTFFQQEQYLLRTHL